METVNCYAKWILDDLDETNDSLSTILSYIFVPICISYDTVLGNIYHIQQKIEASHFKGIWFEIDTSSFHLHTYSMYMNKKGIDMDFKCPFPVWFFWQAEEWDAHIYFIIGLEGNL